MAIIPSLSEIGTNHDSSRRQKTIRHIDGNLASKEICSKVGGACMRLFSTLVRGIQRNIMS